ncbi:hypothetical protein [Nostoc sp.]|uniref:hypothetical protein n=1 Tax=Nostoc sp. TaxID=1180 RepID=UPI002FF9D21F
MSLRTLISTFKVAYILTQVASYAIAESKNAKKAIKSPPEEKKEGFMLNEIIAIYAITDDLLKAIGHEDDIDTNCR